MLGLLAIDLDGRDMDVALDAEGARKVEKGLRAENV